MATETLDQKAKRLLTEGRLTVLVVNPEAVVARCKGDSGTEYMLGWDKGHISDAERTGLMAIETVAVLNWAPGRGFWFTHEQRERETYDEKVVRLAEKFRDEGWEGSPMHDPGECAYCDALRRSEDEGGERRPTTKAG